VYSLSIVYTTDSFLNNGTGEIYQVGFKLLFGADVK
jgi:hypothetical protein